MVEILNRRAKHDYFIEEEYECGIVLTGTEIKAIRDGKCNLKDSYAVIRKNEIYLLNMFISHYKEGNIFNHNETRTRKLLMHKREIIRYAQKVKEKRLTLVPLELYLVKGRAKLLIALGKGKKLYDKREALKERDNQRNLDKAMKSHIKDIE